MNETCVNERALEEIGWTDGWTPKTYVSSVYPWYFDTNFNDPEGCTIVKECNI